jgi:hypothetical protein
MSYDDLVFMLPSYPTGRWDALTQNEQAWI